MARHIGRGYFPQKKSSGVRRSQLELKSILTEVTSRFIRAIGKMWREIASNIKYPHSTISEASRYQWRIYREGNFSFPRK